MSKNIGPYSTEIKAAKSLVVFKDKKLDSRGLPLSPFQDLGWPGWFHKLTFAFSSSPATC